ncbi:MAG: hypothetical protein K2X35_09575 [Bryobacteraceae bacterium]|nr:hypothetical protein [Bryobacteraceae bacterium]
MTAAATARVTGWDRQAWREAMFAEMRARMAKRAVPQNVEPKRAEKAPMESAVKETPRAAPKEAPADGRASAVSHPSALALAKPDCVKCMGRGVRVSAAPMAYCGCVYRCVFRMCVGKYRELQSSEKWVSQVCLDGQRRTRKKWGWGRPHEEFCADLYLISRRRLSKWEWRLFEQFHLGEATWRQLCGSLNVDRGKFFHAVYRVEERLGRAYWETKPYSLYPISEYFGR